MRKMFVFHTIDDSSTRPSTSLNRIVLIECGKSPVLHSSCKQKFETNADALRYIRIFIVFVAN